MPSYCLTCTVLPLYKDLILADWHHIGMLGCEEEELKEGTRLHAYFKDRIELGAAEYAFFRYPVYSAVTISPVEDQDWNRTWRESMEPVKVTVDIWVSPAWLKPPAADGERWIRIEPKLAFGTGHHESTRLAARAISVLFNTTPAPRLVLDIGTGSGVLCFVSAIYGSLCSVGCEIDPVCAQNLSENKTTNALNNGTAFFIGTIDALRQSQTFDYIIMNMIYPDAFPLLPRIRSLLQPSGRLIWSGILDESRQEAIDACAGQGMSLERAMNENEWWCGVFKNGTME